jgi:hypothetical protein
MRRPGTNGGDRHKNNDGGLFLPHGRSGVSSVVKLMKRSPQKKRGPKKKSGPGTSSGDRHKKNDDSLFLPHSRSGISSVVKIMKSARGSSHDKSETQTNNGNDIINPRVNTRRKVSVQVHSLLDSSRTLVPKKRRRRKSNLALERTKYHNFKSLVKFVVKQTKERVNLLQLVMTPFKVCSSLITRLEFVAYPPFIICNFVGPDTNGERFSM